MHRLRRFLSRLGNGLLSSRAERELAREMAAHLALLEDAYRAGGMTPEEARFAARRAMGGVEQAKELQRDARSFRWLDDCRGDVRYALRALARSPMFALVVVASLALGVGAATVVFSVVRTVLLQPPPFAGADRLVTIVENVPAEESFSGRPMRLPAMTQDEFTWWREHARALSHMAAIMPERRTILTPAGAERLAGARVSAALFAMRGVAPVAGRWISEQDERAADKVVVLAESTWQRYFGSGPAAVGRTFVLDGEPLVVVGIMPEAFGPEAFWVPFVTQERRAGAIMMFAVTSRLADGVSLEAATAEVNALGARLRGLPPPAGEGPPRFEVIGQHDQMLAAVRPALRVLAAAVVVVLLIVCANVANLLSARGSARQAEIGVRRAIGATRSRLVRQLAAEYAVLALAGGAGGVAIAFAAAQVVRTSAVIAIPDRFRFALGQLGPTILPRADEIAIDGAALAFSMSLALVTGLLAGITPALRLSRVDHHSISRGGLLANREGVAQVRNRFGRVLAIAQLAMATALLVTAALLIRSFVNLTSLPLGFELDTQVFEIVSPRDYPPSRRIALAEEIRARVTGLPSVAAAGFSTRAQPLEPDDDGATFVPIGWTVDRANPGDENRSEGRSATPGYFQAMGVRLVEGRWFDDRDVGQPRVAIVNRAWARRFSPDRSPVGMTAVGLCRGGGVCQDSQSQIIGVVEDVRFRMDGGLNGHPRPELPKAVFTPFSQQMDPIAVMDRPSRADWQMETDAIAFAVRTTGAPVAAADLRAIVRQIDSRLAVEEPTTMQNVFAGLTARPRFYAAVLAMFAAVAAVIAAIGVYGVLAYAASRRTMEFGVRLALGARPTDVRRLALGSGARLVAIGIACGVALAVSVARFLSSMLFGLTPLDAPTYVTVAVVFAAVGLLASYIPAQRATRVDPLVALRYE